jgi:hypothetical protein
MTKLISVQEIIITVKEHPAVFIIKNSIGRNFTVTTDTVIYINDKSASNIQEVFAFMKSNVRVIANLTLKENSQTNLEQVTFMSIE